MEPDRPPDPTPESEASSPPAPDAPADAGVAPPATSSSAASAAPGTSPAAATAQPPPSPAGHLVAWLALWAVNAAFVLATFPPVRPSRVRLSQLAFDAGHMLAAGLLASSAVEAWQRWGPRRPLWGYLVLGAVGVGVGAAFLRDDLDGLAGRLPGPHGAWLAVLIGLAGAGVPICALVAHRSTRRTLLAAPLALAAVGVAVANEVVLPNDYFGLHLFAAALAATAIGTVLASALARPAAFVAARRSARIGTHVARAALAVAAVFALFSWPGSAVLVELFKVPGSVFAPFLATAHKGETGKPKIPPASAAWFADRSKAPDVPPSAPLVPPKPVVILFVVDCMRADVLEKQANASSLPTMFALRDASVRFTKARTMAPATTQAVSAIMASKAYSQMYWAPIRNAQGADRVFAVEDPSKRFPELLAAAGVPTILSTPLAGLKNELGTGRGFTEERINPKLWAPAAEIADDIVERLKSVGDGPAFIYSQVTDAHAPWPHSGPKGSPQEKYMRGLEKIDAALGAVIRAVSDLGLEGRTVVVLTADHGEAFGEHGDRFHGHTIYDELLRVPLVVRAPGVAPRQVDELVSLVDLAPTVLDLFGLPSPGAFMGQSLVGLMRGETKHLARPVVAESSRHKRAMIFASGMKIIEDRRLGTIELYDLKKDPGERTNLFEDDALSRSPELALLRAYFAAHELVRPGYSLPYQP